jgi:hypothetical protein
MHSLLNRFQGAICGSLLAEKLAGVEYGSFASQLGIEQAQSLIKFGDINLDYYLELENPSSSEIALASLPLILFFHENNQLLTDQLSKIGANLPNSAEILPEVLLWSKAIALALTENLIPSQLIAQLLTSNNSPLVAQQLQEIHSCLEQDLSLKTVVTKLSRQKQPINRAIALALYCFAFSPQDFSISITRARLSGYHSPVTSALTAALAGAYNGYQNIPLTMRLSISQDPQLQNTNNIAKQLFSAWCGVYKPMNHPTLPNHQSVASSNIIQRRCELKLISQVNEPENIQ